MPDFISSRHNPKIQFLDKLKKSSHRKKYGVFLVEGLRELSRAYDSGYIFEIYFCPELFSDHENSTAFLKKLTDESAQLIKITKQVYEKITLCENGKGWIGLGRHKEVTLEEINLPPNPLLIALENIEKPSNIGAIIRTAESAKADGLIVLDQSSEIFNPNVIRNSQGAVFFAPILHSSSQELIRFAKKNNLKIFVTTPLSNHFYFEEDFTQGSVILMGSENNGVTSQWMESNFKKIKIPQNGYSDSLNVSVATAIIVYEAVRQRMLAL